MKTNNWNKFTTIIDNYVNGNLTDYKEQLNKLSKINLIRFTSFLRFGNYNLMVCVAGDGKIILQEIN